MNFRQDEEHQDILEMVHDFAVNEVKPLAAEIDRTEEFPMKNVKMAANSVVVPFSWAWRLLTTYPTIKTNPNKPHIIPKT